jgi:hypothetical protein
VHLQLFFRRILHALKVAGGLCIGKYLQRLYLQGKGSAARLCRVVSTPQSAIECTFKEIIQPVELPLKKPEFFLEGPHKETYLKKLTSCGSDSTTSSGIISANDVDVSLPTGMHLVKGKILEEALLGPGLLINPKYVIDVETIPYKRKKVLPEAVLLSVPWHHNFFHWMIEILPRLFLYDQADDIHHLKLILPASSPRFAKESLDLAGYGNKVFLVEDGVYRFKRLHFLSRLSRAFDVSPFAIRWLDEKFKSPTTEILKRRVYISRSDAKIRYVSNEAEIQNVLSDFGFEIITMSQYPLAEQITLFRQAEIVIGSHGAAFAHLAFMNPGSTFIEFFEAGHFRQCFYRIACLKNLKYGFLVGHKNGLGFSVDVDQLRSLLMQVCK